MTSTSTCTPPHPGPTLSQLRSLRHRIPASDHDDDHDDLDTRSWDHVTDLLKQSLKGYKTNQDVWVDPIMSSLRSLISILTPSVLRSIVESHIAEDRAEQKEQAVATAAASKSRNKGKEKEKDSTASLFGESDEVQEKHQRRDKWRNAALLLMPQDSDEEGEESWVGRLASSADPEGQGEEEGGLEQDDSAWMSVAEAPKLTKFALMIESTETTMGAVKCGNSKLEARFVEGEWKGRALFGKGRSIDYDEDDLRLLTRVGGTIYLTSTPRDLPKLERILELVAFAALSLRLEAQLLRDFQCPRPVAEPESRPPTPPPALPFPVTNGASDDIDDDAPAIPGDYPSDTPSRRRSHRRSKWSKGSLWAILLGSQNRPKQVPMSRSRSLSVNVIRPHPPIPIFPASTLSASTDFVSLTTPKASSRIKDRVRGFGEGLLQRRSRGKLAGDPSTSELAARPTLIDLPSIELQRPQSVNDGERRGGGWDFIGGVGLGIFGPAKREEMLSPRSSPSPVPSEATDPNVDRFQRIISAMDACILSVSPDVVYPPPHLLVRLRQQELAQAPPVDPDDRGQEPLQSSIIDPSHRQRSAMAGDRPVRGGAFPTVDAQALALDLASGIQVPSLPEPTPGCGNRSASGTILTTTATSRATRITLDARAGLQSLMTANMTLSGTFRHQGMQFLVETVRVDTSPGAAPCNPPKWLTYEYYFNGRASSEGGARSADSSLGQVIERLVRRKDSPCDNPTCKAPQKDHCLVLMHSKERLSISLADFVDDEAELNDTVKSGKILERLHAFASTDEDESILPRIATWTSCKICHASSEPSLLSPATYAFSFAKWTELLLYDSDFVPLPDLCSHATEEKDGLVRLFAIDRTVVKVALDPIELFELRLPTAVDPDIDHEAPTEAEMQHDLAPLELLKTEITSFYDSVRGRLVHLAERLESNSDFTAAPDQPVTEDDPESIKRHGRSSSEQTIIEHDRDVSGGTKRGLSSTRFSLSSFESTPSSTHERLRRLEKHVKDNEQDCLDLVDQLSSHQLNEGRYFFQGKARGNKARIAAWEQKYLGEPGKEPLDSPTYSEPEYLTKPGVHLFPVDSSVIVREAELSSLIALTLSARPFQEELATSSSVPSRKVTPQSLWGSITSELGAAASCKPSRQPIPAEFISPSTPTTPSITAESTITNNRSGSQTPPRGFRPPQEPTPVLDPDDFSCEFSPKDEVEFVAKPKKRIKPGSLLRSLGRQRAIDPNGSTNLYRASPLATPTSELGNSLDSSRNNSFRVESKPESVLEDLLVTSTPAASPPSRSTQRRATPSIISGLSVKRHAAEATTTSVMSYSAASARNSTDDLNKGLTVASGGTGSSAADPTIRSIVSLSSFDSSVPSTRPSTPAPSTPAATVQEEEADQLPPLSNPQESLSGSRFLTGALSTFLHLPDSLRGLGSAPRVAERGDAAAAGHTKFNFRHGDKSFRVTAWYAARFQALRARCGLSESLFVESLSRCSDLNPTGGKSSAAFWITGDRRFMLKELVTAWGISERDSFLSFCPALLDYLMSQQVASLLAKIFGFYTIKVRNLTTGETRKLDLVCMEHLFHSTAITRTFDLKGVASRVAKMKPGTGAPESTGKTGWDGDWLTQHRLLIYAHSKTLLREALANDVRFLSENGGVDYSLLVGVDDERKELVIGLIDTLGVFNTLKLVEHQLKAGVKKATASDTNAVTVLPPTDYATRFKAAMDSYFISVPDKFSKPPGDDSVVSDPRLASVL